MKIAVTRISTALPFFIEGTGIIRSVHRGYLNFELENCRAAIFPKGKDLLPFGVEVEALPFLPDLAGKDICLTDGILFLGDSLQVEGWKGAEGFSSVFLRKATDFARSNRVFFQLVKFFSAASRVGASSYLLGGDQDDPIARIFRRSAEELREGILYREPQLFEKGVLALLGMGIGSTPSGDDFLLGLASCLMIFKRDRTYQRLADLILAEAPSRTTFLSNAYFSCGLKGHYHPLVLRFLHAVETGEAESEIRALAAAGHSSGKDFLTGFLYGREFV